MIEEAAKLLSNARRVLVLTGAGISADSGLPTYRGVGGLYEEAEVEEGYTIEELLSGPMFERRPELTWKYIAQLERAYRARTFNRGHQVLAEIEGRYERFTIVTQNVDGFHRDAGSSDVVEIHGEIRKLYCIACDWRTQVRDYAGLSVPPRCPDCNTIIRPDVVLFSEMLDPERVRRMVLAAHDRDLVLTIGTSALFPYILAPVREAVMEGVPTIEINPARTDLSAMVDVHVQLGAAQALDEIAAALR